MYQIGAFAKLCVCVIWAVGMVRAVPSQAAESEAGEERQAGGQASSLSEPLRRMIEQAANFEKGAHFEATVRMALKVAPQSQQSILSLARTLRPESTEAFQAQISQPDPAAKETGELSEPVEPDTLQSAQTADAAKRIQFFSTDGLTGKVELGGSLNTGNTEAEALFAGIDIGRKHGAWSYSVEGEFDFKRSSSRTSKNRLIAEGQVNYDLSDRAYAFATTKYEDDEFSGFSYRVTPSVGMGYELFVTKRFNWSAEAGPGIRMDKDETTEEVETIPVWRLASALLWTLTDTASLENDFEVIGDGGLLIDSTTALNTQITEQLSGRVSYQIRSNTEAPAGREETDTTTKASLVYGF